MSVVTPMNLGPRRVLTRPSLLWPRLKVDLFTPPPGYPEYVRVRRRVPVCQVQPVAVVCDPWAQRRARQAARSPRSAESAPPPAATRRSSSPPLQAAPERLERFGPWAPRGEPSLTKPNLGGTPAKAPMKNIIPGSLASHQGQAWSWPPGTVTAEMTRNTWMCFKTRVFPQWP